MVKYVKMVKMSEIFCLKCRTYMKVDKNGIVVQAGYGVRQGDRFKCPKCGDEVVAGFGEAHDAFPGQLFIEDELSEVEVFVTQRRQRH